MTRAEIAEKFNYVKSKRPETLQEGDCWELDNFGIKEQLAGLGEGAGKIFFLSVKEVNYEGDIPQINLILDSATVYISATKYV